MRLDKVVREVVFPPSNPLLQADLRPKTKQKQKQGGGVCVCVCVCVCVGGGGPKKKQFAPVSNPFMIANHNNTTTSIVGIAHGSDTARTTRMALKAGAYSR